MISLFSLTIVLFITYFFLLDFVFGIYSHWFTIIYGLIALFALIGATRQTYIEEGGFIGGVISSTVLYFIGLIMIPWVLHHFIIPLF